MEYCRGDCVQRSNERVQRSTSQDRRAVSPLQVPGHSSQRSERGPAHRHPVATVRDCELPCIGGEAVLQVYLARPLVARLAKDSNGCAHPLQQVPRPEVVASQEAIRALIHDDVFFHKALKWLAGGVDLRKTKLFMMSMTTTSERRARGCSSALVRTVCACASVRTSHNIPRH